MLEHLDLKLGNDEIAAISSPYIDRGLKQETWEFRRIEVRADLLTATARMTSTWVSPTDPGGFHLSMFVAQEILGQLCNIYLHLAAGLKTKSRESWMRECSFKYRNVIRDPEDIRVEMKVVGLRKLGDALYGAVDCRMTDDRGGLFTSSIKGVLR